MDEDMAMECSGRSDEPLVQLLALPPCETYEETTAGLDELTAIESKRTKEEEHAIGEPPSRS